MAKKGGYGCWGDRHSAMITSEPNGGRGRCDLCKPKLQGELLPVTLDTFKRQAQWDLKYTHICIYPIFLTKVHIFVRLTCIHRCQIKSCLIDSSMSDSDWDSNFSLWRAEDVFLIWYLVPFINTFLRFWIDIHFPNTPTCCKYWRRAQDPTNNQT